MAIPTILVPQFSGIHTPATVPNAALVNSSVTIAVGSGITTTSASIALGGTATVAVDQAFSPTWSGFHKYSNYIDINATGAIPAAPSAGFTRFFAATSNGLEGLGYQTALGGLIVLGRDSIYIARNSTGVSIPAGTPVYTSGASGANPEISPAQSDVAGTKLPCIGITQQIIANNTYGFVMSKGVFAMDTSAWAVGDRLYVSMVAGVLTNVRPVHPNIPQIVGSVRVSSAGSGSIYVNTDWTNQRDTDGTNQASYALGDGTGAAARSILFKNANTGTLQWTPTATRTLTLPDTTGTISVSAAALTSGRVPVATTGGLLQDSNFTATANVLDIAAAGALTIGGNSSTATSMVIGGSTLTSGMTIGIGSGQNLNFQHAGTTTLALTSSTLQWTANGAKTINIATSAADTVGNNLTVNAGTGGPASASGGGAGGVGSYFGGTGGTATTSFAAGTGGQGTGGGGTGGTGAASVNGPGAGGLAIWRGGTGGTVTGGFGGGNGGNAAIRGGLATGTGFNGSVFIGDANTSNVNITGMSGLLTMTAGTTSTWDSKDGTVKAATFDRTTAGTLSIGTTLANAVTIAQNTTISDTKTLTQSYNSAGAARQAIQTLSNSTAATSSIQQWSPFQDFVGHGWGYVPSWTGTPVRTGGNLVTVTCTTAHGMVTGQSVYLSGGDANFTGSTTYGPITVTSTTVFTYASAGSNVTGSAFTWADATGNDQAMKVSVGLRPVVGKRFQDVGQDLGLSAPDLAFYRTGWPNNYAGTVSLSRSGSTTVTATINLSSITRGLVVGQSVTIGNASSVFANGTYVVVTSSGNTFTYVDASSSGSGSITNATFLGAPTEWFRITGTDQIGFGSTEAAYSGSTGSMAIQAMGSNGSTRNSFMQLSPNTDVANGQTWAIYDPFNTVGLFSQKTTGVPNASGYVSVSGSLVPNNGAYGTTGVLGLGDIGTPSAIWYNAFLARLNAQNIGIGDTASAVWSNPYQETGTVGYAPALGYLATPYSLYVAGGNTKFAKMAEPGTVTITQAGSAGTTAYAYVMVAVDRNGFVSNTSYAGTITGNATLSASNYNTLTWTAVSGAARYDIYRKVSIDGAASTIQHATSTSSIVTATTTANHGLSVGDSFYVKGGTATSTVYGSGVFVVKSVSTSKIFTYIDTTDVVAGHTTALATATIIPLTIGATSWLWTGTATTMNHRAGTVTTVGTAQYVNGVSNGYSTPAANGNLTAFTAGPTISGTAGVAGDTGSFSYSVYAFDADGFITPVSGTTTSAALRAPSASFPITVTCQPIGGAAGYIFSRTAAGDDTIIGFQHGGTSTPSGTASLARSASSTVTATVTGGHGLRISDPVTIVGGTGSGTATFASGSFTVVAVTNATVFTYVDASNAGTGTLAGGSYVGPANPTTNFNDYGAQSRTIGAASRNTTGDVAFDGQVRVSAQQAGQSVVISGNTSNSSAQLVHKDDQGAIRSGVDAFGFPSVGQRYEFRENWLSGGSLAASTALVTIPSTNSAWKWSSTANATGFVNTTGIGTGSAAATGLTIGSGTVSGNGAALQMAGSLFAPQNLNNLKCVVEWPQVMSIIGGNGATIKVGVCFVGSLISAANPGGWFFQKVTGNNNWQCVADSGAATTTHWTQACLLWRASARRCAWSTTGRARH
jgi:hypothetical protein